MRESLGIVLSKIEKAVKHLSNPGLKFPFKRLPKQYALANLKIDTCVSYYRNFIVQQKKNPKKPKNQKTFNCHAVEKYLIRLSFFSLSVLKASIFQGYDLTNANLMSLHINR